MTTKISGRFGDSGLPIRQYVRMSTPHQEGRRWSTLHITPESIARTTRTLLNDIVGALEAEAGTRAAASALFNARLACQLLRPKIGKDGQAAMLVVEMALEKLYRKRTGKADRDRARDEIRAACATLQPSDLP